MGVDQLVTGGDVNNPVVDSLEADDLPNVPTLIAQEARLISERTVSTSRAKSTVSGSGSVSGFGNTCQVRTGTTADSFARLKYTSNEIKNSTFGADVVARLTINARSFGSDADDRMFVVISDTAPSKGDYTPEHIGVGVEGGDLVATSADGSTQETTIIESNIPTGRRTVWLVWSASDSKLEVYDGNLPAENTADATQTTNVPNTATVTTVAITTENGTNGNDDQWRMSEYVLGVGR